MEPIFKGMSVALMSPTGTGKTLAFVLPLWARLVEAASGPRDGSEGPRLLIVAPSEDLQLQIGGVVRAIAGRARADSVLVLRRNLPDLGQLLVTSTVVVTTPSLLLEVAEAPGLEAAWRRVAAGLQAVVLDEADCMLPKGSAVNSNLSRLLELLLRLRQQAVPPAPALQLVVASASLDEWTLSFLEDIAGEELALVKAGAVVAPEADTREAEPEAARSPEAPSDDSIQLDTMNMPEPDSDEWPPGLTHMLLPVTVRGGILDGKSRVPKRVLGVVAQAVGTISPKRCLVVLAERRQATERGGSLGKYVNTLRKELRPYGYQLATASAMVETASLGLGARAAGLPEKQVILARNEAIRGLDIEGVDAVVVVGELSTQKEYLHVAGRTGRWAPTTGAPAAGTVVSIVEGNAAKTLTRWGNEAGLRFEQLRLKERPKAAESSDSTNRRWQTSQQG